MKHEQLSKNIGYFILAVLIIVVYKTFDSIGTIFGFFGDILSILSPVFWAFALAFVLHPACRKLECLYKKIPKIASHTRGFSVATVYIIAISLLCGFFAVVLPILFQSISDFIMYLPTLIVKVKDFLYSVEIGGYSLKPVLNTVTIEDVMAKLNLTDVDLYVNKFAGFSKGIVNIFLSVIISIYILLDRAGFLSTVRKLLSVTLPKKARDIFTKYADSTFRIMYTYINCQLLDMCIVACISFGALMILGVPYAPILAIFIGIANLVPYFGAIVACTLSALLTAFTVSFSKAIMVAIILLVLQQVDSNIIQPKLVKTTLKVKPFWVLVGVLLGGELFGILGIILAVPTMALIKTIFEDVYDYRHSMTKTKTKETENIQKGA